MINKNDHFSYKIDLRSGLNLKTILFNSIISEWNAQKIKRAGVSNKIHSCWERSTMFFLLTKWTFLANIIKDPNTIMTFPYPQSKVKPFLLPLTLFICSSSFDYSLRKISSWEFYSFCHGDINNSSATFFFSPVKQNFITKNMVIF